MPDQRPFTSLAVSREGRSFVEWLDENLCDLERRSIQMAHNAALGSSDREQYVAIEQLRLAVIAIRAAI